MMPVKSTQARANQLATLSSIMHRKIVSPKLEKLLAAAEDGQDRLSVIDRALVRVLRREHDQSSKLPESFVAEFSRLTSQSLPVWVEARRQSDFELFRANLEKIVDACRQKAEFLGYAEEPYDALLDLHEEGLLTSRVSFLFERIKPVLVDLIARIGRPAEERPLEIKKSTVAEQIAFSSKVLKKIGYDFDRGRQDHRLRFRPRPAGSVGASFQHQSWP
jgi:carboxypeptidase Taq